MVTCKFCDEDFWDKEELQEHIEEEHEDEDPPEKEEDEDFGLGDFLIGAAIGGILGGLGSSDDDNNPFGGGSFGGGGSSSEW